ncbi:MAG: RNA polymerase-binding protein DksA, partial [Steroidobacteraceae bacterium]
MPVKKPSAKPIKAKKTVSAKIAKPAAPKAPPKAAAEKAKAPTRKVVAKPASAAAPPAKATPAPRPASRPVAVPRPADADFDANASLLSGPRNVQPYQIRKGEEYMSKQQLDHFRLILSSWKQDLMQEVDRTVLH